MTTRMMADRGNQVNIAAANIAIGQAIGAEVRGLMALVALWRNRRATRRDLARMSEHMLRDIGLTPGDAADEIAKPFWRM